MLRLLLLVLFGVVVACPAGAVSPAGQFQGRLSALQRQGSCTELPLFGIGIHQGRVPDAAIARLIADLGARVVRLDIPWIDLERQGQFDFAAYDGLVNELRQSHKLLILALAYGHPDHSDGPGNNVFALPPRTPEQRAAYARYAEAVAKHYRGPDVVYEIWNEPNLDFFWPPTLNVDAYGALLVSAVTAIRNVEPHATILPAGLANENDPPQFMRALAKASALAGVSGLNFHPYRFQEPENSLYDIAEFQNSVVGRAALPLWLTEWGYSEAWPTLKGPDSRTRQAVMIARLMLTAALAGAKSAVIYDLIDDGTDPNAPEASFGLYDHDLKPKPAAAAFRTLADLMAGCTHYEFKVDPQKKMIVATFRSDDATTSVVWAYAERRPLAVCFSDRTQPAELSDVLGNHLELERCGSASAFTLRISNMLPPLVLRGAGSSAK